MPSVSEMSAMIEMPPLPYGFKAEEIFFKDGVPRIIRCINHLGGYAVWEIYQGLLKEGHFFCPNCQGPKQSAEKDYLDRKSILNGHL